MALGKTHDFVNLLFLPAGLYFVPKEFFLSFIVGYLVGTFFLSPDLDIKNSNPFKRWGVLRFLWYPYQAKAKHRGMSHVPFVGTFIRLFYLNVVVMVVYFFFSFLLDRYLPEYTDLATQLNPLRYLQTFSESQSSFYFLLGLVLSESFHIILDIMSSTFGKKKKKKRRY